MARQTKKAIFENKTKTEILADDMIFEMRGMLDPDPEKMERVKSLFMLCLFISQNASSMKPNSDEQANELSKLGRQFRDTQNTIMRTRAYCLVNGQNPVSEIMAIVKISTKLYSRMCQLKNN